MAASAAQHSYGATLSYSATSGGSYTALGEVLSISTNPSVGTTRVTHLTSDNAAHEYIAALFDGGELTLTTNFLKADYNTLYNTIGARVRYYWKVTTPDGSTFVAYGFWTNIPLTVPDDDRITVNLTIKVSGKPTFTSS